MYQFTCSKATLDESEKAAFQRFLSRKIIECPLHLLRVAKVFHRLFECETEQHREILTRIKAANRMDAYMRVLSCSYRTPPQPDEEPDRYFERLAHVAGPGIDVKTIIEDMTIGLSLDEIDELVENRDKTKKIFVVDHLSLIHPRDKSIALIKTIDLISYPVEPMTGQEKRRQRRKSKKKS